MNDSDFKEIRYGRYSSFDEGNGKRFEEGNLSLEELRTFAIEKGEPEVTSGKQELLENIVNRYI